MSTFQTGAAWRFMLRIIGVFHLLGAGLLALIAVANGDFSLMVGAAVAAIAVPGLFFAVAPLTPTFLIKPRSLLIALAALLVAPLISLAGAGVAFQVASPLLPEAILPVLIAAGPATLFMGTFLMPLAAAFPHLSKSPAEQQKPDEATMSDPATKARKGGMFLALEWLITRAAGMVVLGAMLQVTYWFFAGDLRAYDFIFDHRRTGAFLIACTVSAGWLALPTPARSMGAYFYPPKAANILAKILVGVSALSFGVYWALPVYARILDIPFVQMAIDHRVEAGAAVLTSLSLLGLLNFFLGARPAAPAEAPLRPYSTSSEADAPAAQSTDGKWSSKHYQDPSNPFRKTGLEKTHLVMLRLAGLVFFLIAAYGTATIDAGPAVRTLCGSIGFLAAVLLLSPTWTPRIIARPSRWYHLISWTVAILLLFVMALVPMAYTPMAEIARLGIADAEAGIVRSTAEAAAVANSVVLSSELIYGIALALIPLALAGLTSFALLFQAPSATPPEFHARSKAATLDDGKLPTIGILMKLYIATDWLVMRLLGLGLLGTAYLQWTFIQEGREFRSAALAQGLDPMHALYVYGGLGLLMSVPFLLPLFLVRPSNVFGGLMKALLLVVAGFILLPMTHVAIDMFFTDLYRPTLHATVPRLFKAIMGVAVTSALIISFFRQLGKTPKVDYMGRAIRDYSPKELADLRHARMPQ